jgi:hypothetical protein
MGTPTRQVASNQAPAEVPDRAAPSSGGYLQKRWCTTQSHIYRENEQ